MRIPPRALDVLLHLVERPGRIVEKEELLDVVWHGTFVEEGSVNRTVSTLRRILGETATERFIETIPTRGYRFVAPVRRREERTGPFDHVQEEASARPAGPAAPSANEQRVRVSAVSVAAVSDPPPTTLPGQVTRIAPVSQPPEPVIPDREALRRAALEPAVPVARTRPWTPPERSAVDRRWIAIGTVAASLFLVATGIVLWRRHQAPATSNAVMQVAVLPFRFLDGAANAETLGIGLADAVITRLAQSQRLVVRPTTSVLRYAGRTDDPLALGRELSVDAVLEGRVQKAGNRTRVTLQLLRVPDGTSLVARTLDLAAEDDLFAFQDRIAEAAATALATRLKPGGGGTRISEAQELYVRGRFLWNQRSSSGQEASERLFQQAIEIDPNFALAYVGVADSLMMMDTLAGRFKDALASAQRALSIDDSLGEAHASIGFVRATHLWDFRGAEDELTRAMQLSPTYAPAHQWLALVKALTGRLAEARQEIRRAAEIDPLSPSILHDLARVDEAAGLRAESVRTLDRIDAIAPGFEPAKALRAEIDAAIPTAQGRARCVAIVKEYEEAAAASPRPLPVERPFNEWSEAQRKVRTATFEAAACNAALGADEKALTLLGLAHEEHHVSFPLAALDPRFRRLGPNPRFVKMLRDAGVTPAR